MPPASKSPAFKVVSETQICILHVQKKPQSPSLLLIFTAKCLKWILCASHPFSFPPPALLSIILSSTSASCLEVLWLALGPMCQAQHCLRNLRWRGFHHRESCSLVGTSCHHVLGGYLLGPPGTVAVWGSLKGAYFMIPT
jgi:hypothetical protein